MLILGTFPPVDKGIVGRKTAFNCIIKGSGNCFFFCIIISITRESSLNEWSTSWKWLGFSVCLQSSGSCLIGTSENYAGSCWNLTTRPVWWESLGQHGTSVSASILHASAADPCRESLLQMLGWWGPLRNLSRRESSGEICCPEREFWRHTTTPSCLCFHPVGYGLGFRVRWCPRMPVVIGGSAVYPLFLWT